MEAQNTRICGAHFLDAERMCRTQLPTIFPWTPTPVKRRVIEKHDLPTKTKKRLIMQQEEKEAEMNSEVIIEFTQPQADTDIIQTDLLDSNVDLESETGYQHERIAGNRINNDELELNSLQQTSTDSSNNDQFGIFPAENKIENEVEDLKEELRLLKRELSEMRCAININNKKPKFDIDEYKNSDEDISFFTGFPNYDTMVFCFDLLKGKANNLSYGNKIRTAIDLTTRKPGVKRKLNTWQEFTMVVMRLRLGSFEKDLAERFRISVPTVSTICRTWIKFMRKELEPICIHWPSKEQIHFYMPPVFKTFYPDLVSIIDCTELQMESPSSLDKKFFVIQATSLGQQ